MKTSTSENSFRKTCRCRSLTMLQSAICAQFQNTSKISKYFIGTSDLMAKRYMFAPNVVARMFLLTKLRANIILRTKNTPRKRISCIFLSRFLLGNIIDYTHNLLWRICSDNLDKAFANWSPPQEKSDVERNREFELADISGDNSAQAVSEGVKGKHISAPKPAPWRPIASNMVLHRNHKNQSIDQLCCKDGNEELPKKAKFFFSTAVKNWNADCYVKVYDNIGLDLDGLIALLETCSDQKSLYMGCMKSGKVVTNEGKPLYEPGWWKFRDQAAYFRHVARPLIVLLKDLARYINISSVSLPRYAHEDITVG